LRAAKNALPIIRGTDLRGAGVPAGPMDQPVTTFTLSQGAARRFEQYTQAHIGRRSAIVLDDEILSLPVIEDVIRDSGRIRGARTVQEAQDLAAVVSSEFVRNCEQASQSRRRWQRGSRRRSPPWLIRT